MDLTARNGKPIDWRTFEPGRDLPPAAYLTFGIAPPITRMLDWLIRHDPNAAATAIGTAEDRMNLPCQVCENTIGEALSLDGLLDDDTHEDFLQCVFTPSGSEKL